MRRAPRSDRVIILRNAVGSVARIATLLFVVIAAGVYTALLVDDKPLEFVGGVLGAAAALGLLAGLMQNHAGRYSEAVRAGVHRENSNLIQAVLLLIMVSPVGLVLWLMARHALSDTVYLVFYVACIMMIGVVLALALLLAGSSLGYFSDLLGHNVPSDRVEATALKSRGAVARLLGRDQDTVLKPGVVEQPKRDE
jgi:uncharacterized membrane protein